RAVPALRGIDIARKLIFGAILPFAIAGCTVGPDYKPPRADVPASFSTQQPSTQPTTMPVSMERWWESFNDPTLDSLIARAVRTNLDLRIAQSRVREARAQLQIQSAADYPNVNSSAGYTRDRLSKTGFYLPTGAGGRAAPL